ncbi:hypothetical protein IW261DRAFT_1678050 [Armillaria novae-zelandiae]|uniref:Uncharacterized protein n=1 Tax=Armillaria novae-zelandiae TaxID=153914 RepID=A0AA39PDP9_9AGAR|nr:hypothetical protein IW261DRAFT_1678050 [Armillaria novae-zelandiae]
MSHLSSRSATDHPLRTKESLGKNLQPLLRNILKKNMYSISEDSTITHSPAISPVKLRGKIKTPIPKTLNPYLPSNTEPSQWNGVIDLHDPLTTTPQRAKRFGYTRGGPSTPADDSSDDSFDGLPPGMSPPVLMSPTRLPKSAQKAVLGRAPTGQAAAGITKNLVQDIQSHRRGDSQHLFHGSSLARESSLESMMQRANMGITNIATTPGLRLRPKNRLHQSAEIGDIQSDFYESYNVDLAAHGL